MEYTEKYINKINNLHTDQQVIIFSAGVQVPQPAQVLENTQLDVFVSLNAGIVSAPCRCRVETRPLDEEPDQSHGHGNREKAFSRHRRASPPSTTPPRALAPRTAIIASASVRGESRLDDAIFADARGADSGQTRCLRRGDRGRGHFVSEDGVLHEIGGGNDR